MQGSINRLTDIFEKSMLGPAEDPAAASRVRAIELVQAQEDGLSTEEKVAMVMKFMKDTVMAETYMSLTDPEVRRYWVLGMLEA
jgi:hypothetical protein